MLKRRPMFRVDALRAHRQIDDRYASLGAAR